MPHRLLRILDTALNQPHFITEAALSPILDYLTTRSLHMPQLAVVEGAKVATKEPEQAGGIGEIKIDGAITYLPVQAMCSPEGTSYAGILEQAEQLIEIGVETIILTHSSPGGQAQHCFTTANDLRAMCDEAGVKLISYIDTLSASASLAIGIVADEVIIHPSATTGSVGCVCAILDRSKALANAGLKPIYIASTPGKTPFENDGSFSAKFLEELQTDVTRLGLQFAEHVAKYTGLNVDDIVAMDAKMFHAEAALEVGLVNQILDHKQFTAYVAGLHKGKS